MKKLNLNEEQRVYLEGLLMTLTARTTQEFRLLDRLIPAIGLSAERKEALGVKENPIHLGGGLLFGRDTQFCLEPTEIQIEEDLFQHMKASLEERGQFNVQRDGRWLRPLLAQL